MQRQSCLQLLRFLRAQLSQASGVLEGCATSCNVSLPTPAARHANWQRQVWARLHPTHASRGFAVPASWSRFAPQRGFGTAATAGGAAAVSAASAPAARMAVPPSVAMIAGMPDGLRRQVAWWLGGCSAWVFSMVVIGGVTRLTRSGLSMTEWKFAGERPPQTEQEWAAEFSKYQASPEFKRVHSHMKLEEFKFIYWMEWAHRMWGRVLGLAFVGPAAYFAARGAITAPLGQRLGLLLAMGGTQGLVGWWMVRSGLQEPDNPHSTPRVSPYRLAAHLTSAFAIYATLVWTTLGLAWPAPASAGATEAVQRGAALLRGRALPVAALVGVTAVSGAYVAGMDAGRAYNTFPTMNGKWVPDEYWELPGWRNAFENTAAVQLHHRVLALSTLTAVTSLWLSCRALPLPPAARLLLAAAAATTAAQVTLGVTTLLNYVPVSLGAAHQAGALTLFTVFLGLLHAVRPAHPSALAAALGRVAVPLALAATTGIGVAVTQTR